MRPLFFMNFASKFAYVKNYLYFCSGLQITNYQSPMTNKNISNFTPPMSNMS